MPASTTELLQHCLLILLCPGRHASRGPEVVFIGKVQQLLLHIRRRLVQLPPGLNHQFLRTCCWAASPWTPQARACERLVKTLGGARTDGDVVILGEDPAVEIGGHVVAHVHLGQVLVVLHLVVRDADALLRAAAQDLLDVGVYMAGFLCLAPAAGGIRLPCVYDLQVSGKARAPVCS